MATKKELTLEKALENLENIVSSLESGDQSLDKALALFEEGVKLVKLCSEKLDSADEKVKQLIDCNGELVETDFTGGDDDEN